jgi:hypothetical protein
VTPLAHGMVFVALDSSLPAGIASASGSAMLYLLARRRPATRATVCGVGGAHGSGWIVIVIRIGGLANVVVLDKRTGGSWLKGVVWQGERIRAM